MKALIRRDVASPKRFLGHKEALWTIERSIFGTQGSFFEKLSSIFYFLRCVWVTAPQHF
jgi:hypothetical protein